MNVLLNGLVVSRGGHKTYFSNIISRFGELAEEHDFLLLHAPCQQQLFPHPLPDNVSRLTAAVPPLPAALRVGWEQVLIPFLVRRHRIDLVFSPTPATALFCGCPLVVAVRNPNPFDPVPDSDWRYRARNAILRLTTRAALRRARAAIFVSRHSRTAAMQKLGIHHRRAVVIPHGIGDAFLAMSPDDRSTRPARARPYVLTVSTIQTHKNQLRLLEAFSRVCSVCPRHRLLIAGAVGSARSYAAVRARMQRPDLLGRVEYLGEIPYDELPGLYRAADLFVLPSLRETFGHPLVEAMASGTAVAASRISAIPEVCGGAAAYFDPYDVDDIAGVISSLLVDDERRAHLAHAGIARAHRFSWTRTVTQMVQLFTSCLDEGSEAPGNAPES